MRTMRHNINLQFSLLLQIKDGHIFNVTMYVKVCLDSALT